MSESFPRVIVVRHGETEWSLAGKHTGRTDLALTPEGEKSAQRLGERLRAFSPIATFTSPLQRARRTCELAGFGPGARADADMVEWDYGDYEGIPTSEIRRERPDWMLFRDGCPNGESPAQVRARADRVIGRLRAIQGDVLVFGHRHFSSMLGVRWVGWPADHGAALMLSEVSISVLTYHHTMAEPVFQRWNA